MFISALLAFSCIARLWGLASVVLLLSFCFEVVVAMFASGFWLRVVLLVYIRFVYFGYMHVHGFCQIQQECPVQITFTNTAV